MSGSRDRPPRDSDGGEATKPLRLRRGLLIYAIAILSIGWAYGLRTIYVDRELTLESSQHQLVLSATGLANHVSAMINDGVGAAIAGTNEVRALARTRRLTDQEMSQILERMLTGGEYVKTLFVATPTRFVAANRTQPNTARPDWADRLIEHTSLTWVGEPISVGTDDTNVLVPIAKRVAAIGGEPAWAGAYLTFTQLDDLYRTLPIEYSAVAVSHRAGVLLVRIPSIPGERFVGRDISQSVASQTYRKLPSAPLTAFTASDEPFSSKERQFAVRMLDGYPLNAIASRDVENSLRAWRARTRDSLLVLVAGSVTVLALTVPLFLLLRRRFTALQASEERFQLIAEGSSSGIWDWDAQTNYVYYSPRLKEQLGIGPDDDFPPVQESFYALMHPEDLAPTRAAVERHLRQRVPYDVEYRIRSRNGEYRWYSARAQAIWNERGEPVRMAGSITDIHDKRMAEASLSRARAAQLHAREEFAQHLLSAQEAERQRLARELHDSVGQNLSLIKNRALLALNDSNVPPAIRQHAAAVEQLASDVIAEVRSVARNLRPLHIEDLGLTAALEDLLDQVAESSGLAIERRLENVDDVLVGAPATHVFRIVQEAFNNIMKHARAQTCRVSLERDLHCVRLTVSDDGIGFDSQTDALRHGLGLASMEERARILSASFRLRSAVHAGTTIDVEIPVVEIETKDASIEEAHS